MITRRLAVATVVMALVAAAGSAHATKKKESNRQVMDRFFAVVDAKDLDKLAEVDAVALEMTMPMGPVKGLEGHRMLLKGFATAFPNFKHSTSRCVEAGDLISCEGVFSGDHTGPMMLPDGSSIPATGKHVEFPYLGIARIKDGKVAELHVYFDVMGFMGQLGLLPAPTKMR
jgi:predicted ester cyclase